METSHTAQADSPAAQIKILADSADEAVKMIKEKYGDAARVLSVKQKEGSGLKRLISKPRLEVIVEIPRPLLNKKAPAAEAQPEQPAAPKAKADPAPVASSDSSESEPSKKAEKNAVSNLYYKSQDATPKEAAPSKSYFNDFETAATALEPEPAPLGTAANPVKKGTVAHVQRAISMLEAVGFDRSLIERIRYDLDFKEIGDMPAMELYSRICDWLRNHFPDTSDITLLPRRAFIGSCGTGKTAALCKQLSADVFMNGLEPAVLKIDSGIPNPTDGLESFCEIMNAPLFRSMDELEEFSSEQPLFVDMPGINFGDPDSVAECRDLLDELEVEERVLVINAAYESEMIAEALVSGERIGATRVVFTHLDETRRAGKLWKFILKGGVSPLFFSRGSNPAGDYTTDVFSYLLEKTFPQSRGYSGMSRSRAAERKEVKEAIEA